MEMPGELKMDPLGVLLVSMELENVKEILLKVVPSKNTTSTLKAFPSSFVWNRIMLIGKLLDRNVLLNTIWIGMP